MTTYFHMFLAKYLAGHLLIYFDGFRIDPHSNTRLGTQVGIWSTTQVRFAGKAMPRFGKLKCSWLDEGY